MSTAIDEIAIQSIYTKEVYGFDSEDAVELKRVTEYQSDILYFKKEVDEDGSETYTYVHNDNYNDGNQSTDYLVGVLTEEEFAAGEYEYYSYGEAKGMWRLILFRDGHESVYTLNNFNNMIAGCTTNINNATLGTLKEAGIIDENADLSGTLRWTENGVPKQAKLEEMQLSELINAVIAMSKAVPTT